MYSCMYLVDTVLKGNANRIARRTGVIFCVFWENRRESQASAQRESRARGEARKNQPLYAYHRLSSSAPRHTLNDKSITYGALSAKFKNFQGLVFISKTEKLLLWDLNEQVWLRDYAETPNALLSLLTYFGAFQNQCKQTMINKYSNKHN